ncbi:hypothetical protein SCLCIDRAFT_689864 [Scleroderma citrinum Foug A]|uniref:Uncharacterized protein n=1 Tax=Scleroderma citrinum Foug A TaxID=1036808 RepID=A0A0C3DT24_9AGAM|nr:hypothetical protein SCLCIDRAFT_689864 [Scleroderma citrinum Foug A]
MHSRCCMSLTHIQLVMDVQMVVVSCKAPCTKLEGKMSCVARPTEVSGNGVFQLSQHELRLNHDPRSPALPPQCTTTGLLVSPDPKMVAVTRRAAAATPGSQCCSSNGQRKIGTTTTPFRYIPSIPATTNDSDRDRGDHVWHERVIEIVLLKNLIKVWKAGVPCSLLHTAFGSIAIGDLGHCSWHFALGDNF